MDVTEVLMAVARLKRAMPRNPDVLLIDEAIVELVTTKPEAAPEKQKVDRKQYMREYMRKYRQRS